MIFTSINNNLFRLNILKDNINDLNIFDYDDVKKFIFKILEKYIFKYNLLGTLYLDVYIDDYYGIIVDIKRKNFKTYDDYVEIKITFHLDNIFLYKIDYFDLLENTNIKKQRIYYYKNNYYLEIINEINTSDYFNLLEISDIYYNDNDDIIEKGTILLI